MEFTTSLEARIQSEYDRLGYRLGWKLLYSPKDVIEGARIAFIGLNPGGSKPPNTLADLAVPAGSAYTDEIWEGQYAAGQSKLQIQVRALFDLIGEAPDRVLAGNLVPFRSPSWETLQNRQSALRFGGQVWRAILDRAKPTIVIGMGTEVWKPLKEILHVQSTNRVPVGWGNISGERGHWSGGGLFVGLPHLSRFAIVTRSESQPGLRALFQP